MGKLTSLPYLRFNICNYIQSKKKTFEASCFQNNNNKKKLADVKLKHKEMFGGVEGEYIEMIIMHKLIVVSDALPIYVLICI